MSEANQQVTMQDDERSTPTFVASDTLLSSDLAPTTDAFEPLPRAHRLGPYQLRGELGRGGMGIVYTAWDPRLDRRVAIKMLDTSSDAQRQLRLLREARAMAKLTHPNVITLHEIGEDETGHYIVMEHVAGRTLRSLLDDPKAPLAGDELLRVFIDAGRGLAAIHDAGLVHRDIKPDNIMVRETGQVLVMDLGIAAGELDGEDGPALPLDTDELLAPGKLTRTGMMMGSPGYMAPEQFKQREITPLSDQFSFCVTLWEAVYAERPFQGKTLRALAKAVTAGEPKPPAASAGPAWLHALLLRGLSVEPHARFSSMDELLQALEQGRGASTSNRRWPWVLAGGMGLATAAALMFPRPEPSASERDASSVADTAPAPTDFSAVPTTDIDELTALSHTVAALRYFHPSDAAAEADWDQLTAEAAAAVTAGHDAGALRESLAALVEGVAPTAQLYFEAEPPPAPALEGSGPMVAWQHIGLAVGNPNYRGYHSNRLSRPGSLHDGTIVLEDVPIESAHTKARLRVRARMERGLEPGSAKLWVQPLTYEGSFDYERIGYNHNLSITDPEWRSYEIVVELPPGTKTLLAGLSPTGSSQTWLDKLELELFDDSGAPPQALPLANGEFDAVPTAPNSLHTNHGWAYKTVYELGPNGRNAMLRIARKLGWVPGQLFETTPTLGETREIELGHGLVMRMPVALPDSLARGDAPPSAARPSPTPTEAEAAPDPTPDLATRQATVILAWAALDQFWPYFETTPVDWDLALREALEEAARAQDRAGLVLALEHMTAKLDDSFAAIRGGPARGIAPLSFAHFDGKVIVTHTLEDSSLQLGDELLSIDGEDIGARLRQHHARNSGSPQYKEVLAFQHGNITSGPLDKPATLELRRGEERISLSVPRVARMPQWARPGPAIEYAPDGIVYIDLCRASWDQIEAQLPRIASAPGVVFDIRGRPTNGVEKVLSHIFAETTDAYWMSTPMKIYPDDPGERSRERWNVPPATEPYIRGKVAFITDARTVGYGESILGLFEGYVDGEIVGAPSAGNNGNRNIIALPTGLRLSFTGMLVTGIGGRLQHGVGIQPTESAKPTRAGVEAGRDEVRERALDVVRGIPAPAG